MLAASAAQGDFAHAVAEDHRGGETELREAARRNLDREDERLGNARLLECGGEAGIAPIVR